MSLTDRAVRRYRESAYGYHPTKSERWADAWGFVRKVARALLGLTEP